MEHNHQRFGSPSGEQEPYRADCPACNPRSPAYQAGDRVLLTVHGHEPIEVDVLTATEFDDRWRLSYMPPNERTFWSLWDFCWVYKEDAVHLHPFGITAQVLHRQAEHDGIK